MRTVLAWMMALVMLFALPAAAEEAAVSIEDQRFELAENLVSYPRVTGLADAALEEAVNKTFDLRPAAIIRDLDLRRPIYRQTAAYGHFGRPELDLPWERTDRVDELKAAL